VRGIAGGQREAQVALHQAGGQRLAEGQVVAVGFEQGVGRVQERQAQPLRGAPAGPTEAVLGAGVDDVELLLADPTLHGTWAHQPQAETGGGVEGQRGEGMDGTIRFRAAGGSGHKDDDIVASLLQPLLELDQRGDDAADGRLVTIGQEPDHHAGLAGRVLSNLTPVTSATQR
jgi:hypothetical protein